MPKSETNRVGLLIETMCNMICSVEETRKRLNAARQQLSEAGKRNEQINSVLERCIADMRLSEKLVISVQTKVETVIQTQAA